MLKRILSQSYLIAMAAAILIGLFVPEVKFFSRWNTLILQIVFFLSCLRLDLGSAKEYAKDWKFISLATFLMLIGFPLLVRAIGLIWPSDLMFAIYLLAAMPIGMTAALLVELAGGKAAITMMLTVTTSLLAPFTIPILTKLLYGASISVSAFALFKDLAMVIFIPFALSLIVRFLAPKLTEKAAPKTKTVSVALLALLIAAIIAKQAGPTMTLTGDWIYLATIVLSLYAFFFVTNLIGYWSFWWEAHETKQTASVSLACMNFTLAIYLAGQFFPKPTIVLPLVFAIVPWVTFMPIWMKVSARWK
jgi:bile acid:Na+ symporter, BASS family